MKCTAKLKRRDEKEIEREGEIGWNKRAPGRGETRKRKIGGRHGNGERRRENQRNGANNKQNNGGNNIDTADAINELEPLQLGQCWQISTTNGTNMSTIHYGI